MTESTGVMTLLVGTLGLYLVLIIGLSSRFARGMQTLIDYFLAGRTLGVWPVAISFVASWFGAASTIGSLTAYHDQGLSALWLLALPSVCSTLVVTFLFSRRVSDQKSLSQPEAIERHYGRLGRFFLSWVILCAVTTLIGSQLVAAGKLCQAAFGLDLTTSTALVTVAVVLYSMVGGYFAVVLTDIAQFVMFTLGLLILAIACGLWGNNVSGFWQALAQPKTTDFWNPFHNLGEHLSMLVTFVLAWSIAPEMWQRMSSTPNRTMAFRAALIATLCLVGLFILVAWIGLLSSQLAPGPGDNVLLTLAMRLPHPLLASLVILGVMAAITSTMDSSLNVGSLTVARDLYQGFVRPGASERELLWVSRLATVLVPLPAVAIALHYQDIIQVLWISADIYACTMFFPVVGLLYCKQPGRWSGVLAMVLGGLAITVSAANQYHWIDLPFAWPGWPYSTLVGVTFSGLGFLAGWLWERRTTAASPLPALASPEA